jgi:hypothetical protein
VNAPAALPGLGHNGGPSLLDFRPQDGPQKALLTCPIGDIFFGGARGGGKTYGMLLDWIEHATKHGRYATGVFFRKIFKNLEEVIAEAHRIFPHFGGRWEKGSATYVFRTGPMAGARLKFRHLANEDDANAYQGHAYTWICFEEMTQWANPAPIDLLRATLRSAYGVPCVFRATGNPGGAGHNWVKARYISPWKAGFKVLVDAETGEKRMFIPSKLEDNQILMKSDPQYEAKLRRVGTPALVKAWRFGNWDIVAGGFFDDLWNDDKLVLKPFELPQSWIRRRSFDWGSSKPGSLGLWAISDGFQPRPRPGQVLPYFPAGSFIRFGEWYIAAHEPDGSTKPNVGLKLSNVVMGQEIAARTHMHNWHGDVADPSIFVEAGGESVYQQLQRGAKLKAHQLNWSPADNSRVTGWAKMRAMFEAAVTDDLESPGLWCFETCTDFIRTIPVLQADKQKPDDVDSDGEDHIGDETRYAVMSRGGGSSVGTAKVQGR